MIAKYGAHGDGVSSVTEIARRTRNGVFLKRPIVALRVSRRRHTQAQRLVRYWLRTITRGAPRGGSNCFPVACFGKPTIGRS